MLKTCRQCGVKRNPEEAPKCPICAFDEVGRPKHPVRKCRQDPAYQECERRENLARYYRKKHDPSFIARLRELNKLEWKRIVADVNRHEELNEQRRIWWAKNKHRINEKIRDRRRTDTAYRDHQRAMNRESVRRTYANPEKLQHLHDRTNKWARKKRLEQGKTPRPSTWDIPRGRKRHLGTNLST